jgi:hypothetical protein
MSESEVMYWELVNRLSLYGSGYLPGPEAGEAGCLFFLVYFTVQLLCFESNLYEFQPGYRRWSWLRYFTVSFDV